MIGSLLGHWARYHPHKTALICDGRRISFQEHHERAVQCVAALQALGLRRGDTVAAFMANRVELLELYRACALLGIVMVPVSPLLQAPGVAVVLRDSGAAAIFAQPSLLPVLDALRPALPVLAEERWVRFDAAEFIDTVLRESVTHVMMVPSQIAAVLAAPNFSRDALASLRMLCSVGAPLPQQHRQRLLELLPGAVYELYGLTEGFATVLDGADAAAHPGTVGIPLPFHELRIIGGDGKEVAPGTVGEIVGRGPLLMPGYHRQPELTERAIVDGWLHTGDLGFVDTAGFLHLLDRQKDLIISGGVNVYPRDIEEIVSRHPAVREVAVFGVPDPKWGEHPVAAVLLRRGECVDAAVLREWINANVAARFQRVHDVVLHDEFPRNAAGKTLKRELRERWLAPRASDE